MFGINKKVMDFSYGLCFDEELTNTMMEAVKDNPGLTKVFDKCLESGMVYTGITGVIGAAVVGGGIFAGTKIYKAIKNKKNQKKEDKKPIDKKTDGVEDAEFREVKK